MIGTAAGFTLYVFKTDTPAVGTTPPSTACTASCLSTWPIYYAATVSLPAGLVATDFSFYDRGGGVLQSTYKGYPLYTYASDTLTTDVKGEAFGGKWYSAKNPFVLP